MTIASPRSGMTAVPPNSMTAAERLDEAASILAAGCRRLIALESKCAETKLPRKRRKFASTSASVRAFMDAKPTVENGHE